jgi:hypothetical protein
MSSSAAILRDRLRTIGRVKAASAAADTRLHLELDPGERLAVTLAHCDAHLEAFPDRALSHADEDDAFRLWARIRRQLAGS